MKASFHLKKSISQGSGKKHIFTSRVEICKCGKMSSGYMEELKITTPLLIWAIVITAILTALGNLFIFFLPWPFSCNMNAGTTISTPGFEMLGMPFVMSLIIALLMRIPSAKKYLSAGVLVLLYTTALAASAFANTNSPWREIYALMTARLATAESVMVYVPEFVSPPREAAEVLIRGAGSVTAIPWNKFIPVMVWWFFMFAFFAGISIGLASIFRRQWMDVEMLPYPQITVAYSAIMGAGEVSNPKWAGRWAFILGFIVGLGLELIRAGILFFPWFPDIYSIRSNTCGGSVTHWLSFPGTTWHYGLTKLTPVYALLLLAPLHSLFSIVFWGIVYEIASAVAVALGYYTGYVDMGFCGKSWCGQGTPFAEPPLAFGSLISGVMLGAFIMTIFHERHHIVMTLKMAFGGVRDTKVEAEEPMSYRSAWIILIVSFILLVALFTSTGMSVWASFVITLTGVVVWFTTSQLWARVGGSNEPGYNFGPFFAKMLLWPPTAYMLPVTSADTSLAQFFIYEPVSHCPSNPWCSTFYAAVGPYKMAKMMNVHPRGVVKITSVSLITAIFVACIMMILLPGVYGRGVTGCIWAGNIEFRINDMWNRPAPRPIIEIAPWITGGFIFMVIMSFLHTRFLWMPDPLMSIIAWDWIGGLHGIWMAALICSIVKWLILRIGGSKLYEEKAIPFAGGFMLGAALNALIAGIGAFIAYPR
jgi:hypothetical protein